MNIIQLIGYISCVIVIIALVKNNKEMISSTSNDFSSDELLQMSLDDIDMV